MTFLLREVNLYGELDRKEIAGPLALTSTRAGRAICTRTSAGKWAWTEAPLARTECDPNDRHPQKHPAHGGGVDLGHALPPRSVLAIYTKTAREASPRVAVIAELSDVHLGRKRRPYQFCDIRR